MTSKVTRDKIKKSNPWHPQIVSRVTFLSQNWWRKTPLGHIKIKISLKDSPISKKIEMLIRDQHREKLDTPRNSIYHLISKFPYTKNKNEVTFKISIQEGFTSLPSCQWKLTTHKNQSLIIYTSILYRKSLSKWTT